MHDRSRRRAASRSIVSAWLVAAMVVAPAIGLLTATPVVAHDGDHSPTALDVDPETDTGVQGTTFTLTATVYDEDGEVSHEDTEVRFYFVPGSDNDPHRGSGADLSCDTGSDGRCEVSYTADEIGTDYICGLATREWWECIESVGARERDDLADLVKRTITKKPDPTPTPTPEPTPAPTPTPTPEPTPAPTPDARRPARRPTPDARRPTPGPTPAPTPEPTPAPTPTPTPEPTPAPTPDANPRADPGSDPDTCPDAHADGAHADPDPDAHTRAHADTCPDPDAHTCPDPDAHAHAHAQPHTDRPAGPDADTEPDTRPDRRTHADASGDILAVARSPGDPEPEPGRRPSGAGRPRAPGPGTDRPAVRAVARRDDEQWGTGP